MKPVTIDPRLHDAVIFDFDSLVAGGRAGIDDLTLESTVTLARKLPVAEVATVIYSPARQCEQLLTAAGFAELFTMRFDGAAAGAPGLPAKPDPTDLLAAAGKLGAAPQRSVVVDAADAGVETAKGGFAVVISVDGHTDADELRRCGADIVVADLGKYSCDERDQLAVIEAHMTPQDLAAYHQLWDGLGNIIVLGGDE
jgi:beta-phosphoglucomutase-like phosphatase (HAD superfamily)